jgi:hypothetical protein
MFFAEKRTQKLRSGIIPLPSSPIYMVRVQFHWSVRANY